jgi:hypothetical protein
VRATSSAAIGEIQVPYGAIFTTTSTLTGLPGRAKYVEEINTYQ